MTAIDLEIATITNEIGILERIRERLAAVRDQSGDAGDAPKVKRGRKPRKAGLPSAVPPASSDVRTLGEKL